MGAYDEARYQARFDELARRGVDVHGEADLVRSFGPGSVLDAGCGTGRVAIELARNGTEVVGVDVDRSMIAEARRRSPDLVWVEADLVGLDLGRTFDVVLMAGNVLLFTRPGTVADVVATCARHVAEGGRLIAGFQLGRGVTLTEYDAACAAEGLSLSERWATWDRQAFEEADGEGGEQGGGDYAVSVHRR